MAETTKQWFTSKTIWSDILTAVVGIYAILVPVLSNSGIKLPPIDGGVLGSVLGILAGFGIYGRKTATTKIIG